MRDDLDVENVSRVHIYVNFPQPECEIWHTSQVIASLFWTVFLLTHRKRLHEIPQEEVCALSQAHVPHSVHHGPRPRGLF